VLLAWSGSPIEVGFDDVDLAHDDAKIAMPH
jgi:hypothetical protein